MALRWAPKDPDEVLDYTHDWTPRGLSGDEIDTTSATVSDGDVVVDAHGITNGETLMTTTWLSGGTAGETCTIALEAVTDAGRTLQETVTIKIKER